MPRIYRTAQRHFKSTQPSVRFQLSSKNYFLPLNEGITYFPKISKSEVCQPVAPNGDVLNNDSLLQLLSRRYKQSSREMSRNSAIKTKMTR